MVLLVLLVIEQLELFVSRWLVPVVGIDRLVLLPGVE
jgi:hypothetical protein